MTPQTGRAAVARAARGSAGAGAAAILLTGFGLTGCGVVKAVKQVSRDVESNKATIDAFTGRLKAGEATTFEARYMTTGSSPAKVLYAVRPPDDLALSTAAAGNSSANEGLRVHLVVNTSGAYDCTPRAASGAASRAAWSWRRCSGCRPAPRSPRRTTQPSSSTPGRQAPCDCARA